MGGSGNYPANFMIIGRWSEFRVVIELQRDPAVRCTKTISRSGEELGPVHGILVGSSSLRRASLDRPLLQGTLVLVTRPLMHCTVSALHRPTPPSLDRLTTALGPAALNMKVR